jgi:hypothetical protein
VFRTDPLNLASHMLRWATRLVSGGAPLAPTTHGMLNSEPLRQSEISGLPPGRGDTPETQRRIVSPLYEA